MKVQCFQGLKGSTEIQATQVVVYDDLDQPIAILSSPGRGVITIDSVGNPDFHDRLKELAIKIEPPRQVIQRRVS